MTKHVLRTKGQRAGVVIVAAFFATSTLVTHFEGADYTGDVWVTAATLAALLVYLWIASWSRCRVVVDDDGVTVVNPLRRHRVAWAEVRGFGFGSWRVVHAPDPEQVPWSQAGELRWGRWHGLGMMPKMCAILRDGSVVPMFGLMVGGGGLGGSAKEHMRTLIWALERARTGKPL